MIGNKILQQLKSISSQFSLTLFPHLDITSIFFALLGKRDNHLRTTLFLLTKEKKIGYFRVVVQLRSEKCGPFNNNNNK